MSEALPELLTIGHSNHRIEVFLDLLKRHRIEAIADVRSRPYSRFVPHFSKQRLAWLLQQEGIGYIYLGAELGGKPVRGAAPSAAPDYASRIAEPGSWRPPGSSASRCCAASATPWTATAST
jgi:hypothetical protein